MAVLTPSSAVIDLFLLEFTKLKDEQIKRIEYRDHLIHLHLAFVGASAGWALANASPFVFLLIPWISFVLGWAYITNDEKISMIGRYIREVLIPLIQLSQNCESIFLWENYHRSDERRTERKSFQYLIDQIQFVASGLGATIVFIFSTEVRPLTLTVLLLGLASSFLLSTLLLRYSDRRFDSRQETSFAGK